MLFKERTPITDDWRPASFANFCFLSKGWSDKSSSLGEKYNVLRLFGLFKTFGDVLRLRFSKKNIPNDILICSNINSLFRRTSGSSFISKGLSTIRLLNSLQPMVTLNGWLYNQPSISMNRKFRRTPCTVTHLKNNDSGFMF